MPTMIQRGLSSFYLLHPHPPFTTEGPAGAATRRIKSVCFKRRFSNFGRSYDLVFIGEIKTGNKSKRVPRLRLRDPRWGRGGGQPRGGGRVCSHP